MSKTALAALALACASRGARAEFITFDATLPGYYAPPAPPTSFSTVGSGGGNYTVTVGPSGYAALGSGTFASGLCGTGGNTCSDNGTQALYASSGNPLAPGVAMVTLTPATGFLLSLSAFDAAIASTQPGACLLDLGFGCLISLPDLTLSTDIHVYGTR